MTLHVYTDLVQGSPEWLEARRGIVTASTVGQLITAKTVKRAESPASRALTMKLVAERITDWPEDGYVSYDMQRGSFEEPIARDAYAKSHGVEVAECGFMLEDGWGFEIGYSPDGLVGEDGLIEVKSRRRDKQLATILADEVPAENMAQLQCGLLVSSRAWIDYVSFCGGMPLYTKRVFPDGRWFDAIAEAVGDFEAAAAEMQARYDSAVAGLPLTERTDFDALYNVELKL